MSIIPKTDCEILRALGNDFAEAAADPVNEERRRVCHLVDKKQKSRPSISIFQEPWHELNVNGELDIHCADPFCQGIEQDMRRTLYKWRPNPAYVAHDRWDPDLVRNDMEEKLAMAADHGCVVAIYLKDISTVRGEPQRLTDWDKIARECVAKYA